MQHHVHFDSIHTFGSRWTRRRRLNEQINTVLNDIRAEDTCNDAGACENVRSPPKLDHDFPTQHSEEISTSERISISSKTLMEQNSFVDMDLTDKSVCSDSAGELADESDCHIDSDSAESDNRTFLSVDDLRFWAIQFKIKHDALGSLLTLLNKSHPYFPKHPRTLLKTPVTNQYVNDIKEIEGGSYYHFGMVDGILSFLQRHPKQTFPDNKIWLQINIDGLPLFKSSNVQFWPILGMVDRVQWKEPFVIGLFCGSKPKNIAEFLNDFVNELRNPDQNIVRFHSNCFSVNISSFVCDAPARSLIKNCKPHNAYSGCERCMQEGLWCNKMTYPEINAQLRTDADFESMLDENHHKGTTPLSGLRIGLVSQFPLDYMHLVCLGVTRFLLRMWMRGPLRCRISGSVVNQISDALISLRKCIPKEFARKPRSLYEVDRWKATEFRQFLLYTGPVVLKNVISYEQYELFMLLSCAMHILLKNDQQKIDIANGFLVKFVKNCAALFGKEALVYNVHSLIHLCDDAKIYGSLNNIAAFPYENFLGQLKRLIRKPQHALQQAIRRYGEIEIVNSTMATDQSNDVIFKKPVCQDGVEEGCTQYQEVHLNQQIISTVFPNNVIFAGGKIAIVDKLVTDGHHHKIVCKIFMHSRDFFDLPVPSTYMNMYKVNVLSQNTYEISIFDVKKCCLLKFKENNFAIPLSHC